MKRYLTAMGRLFGAMIRHPWVFARAVKTVPSVCGAHVFARGHHHSAKPRAAYGGDEGNLREG